MASKNAHPVTQTLEWAQLMLSHQTAGSDGYWRWLREVEYRSKQVETA